MRRRVKSLWGPHSVSSCSLGAVEFESRVIVVRAHWRIESDPVEQVGVKLFCIGLICSRQFDPTERAGRVVFDLRHTADYSSGLILKKKRIMHRAVGLHGSLFRRDAQ